MILEGLNFVKTCGACPEQYDVYDGEQKVGYVRLRHGWVSCEVPDCGGKMIYETSNVKGDGIFSDEEERTFHLTLIAKAISLEEATP